MSILRGFKEKNTCNGGEERREGVIPVSYSHKTTCKCTRLLSPLNVSKVMLHGQFTLNIYSHVFVLLFLHFLLFVSSFLSFYQLP